MTEIAFFQSYFSKFGSRGFILILSSESEIMNCEFEMTDWW